jgi:HSP20 family protein
MNEQFDQSQQKQQASQGNGAQAGMPQTVAGQQSPAQQGAQQGALQERQSGAILIPPVDVVEDAAGITLVADLPGVSRDKLHLRLDANSLTIEGELTLDSPQQMDSRYAEVRHRHYQRTFALSRDLDPDQAVAELKHGVLTLRIPKAQHAQPRKIDIQVA